MTPNPEVVCLKQSCVCKSGIVEDVFIHYLRSVLYFLLGDFRDLLLVSVRLQPPLDYTPSSFIMVHSKDKNTQNGFSTEVNHGVTLRSLVCLLVFRLRLLPRRRPLTPP